MWISQIKLTNIRGFREENSIELSRNINLFVGQNNAGKSTLLNALLLIQLPGVMTVSDITLDQPIGTVELVVNNISSYIDKYGETPFKDASNTNLEFKFNRRKNMAGRTVLTGSNNSRHNFEHTPNSEPANLVYPFLSKRKVPTYDETINLPAMNSVTGTFSNLYAKINRLCNVNHPSSEEYQDACKEIIGFPISPIPSQKGQQGGYLVDGFSNILLSSMGEGIPNLLGLIVDLCIADDKIFLIEEPENDIHPHALKALLELIVRKSKKNQFLISTHSNIVTKYLGSVVDSKVFKVSMSFDVKSRLPISTVELVENDPRERIKVLEELGYEPFDFGQWKAWLFLEESSAEIIIREFLIPWFANKLKNSLRTFSARSLSEVGPKFKDFNNLFVFIHLETVYKNKAWVLVDSGEAESTILAEMKEKYVPSGWSEDHFLQLDEHDFERYYPHRFQNEVTEILAIANKKQKMVRKKDLIERVKEWAQANPVEAKAEFAESAKEVVDVLRNISRQIS